jgi:hypothetical protein
MLPAPNAQSFAKPVSQNQAAPHVPTRQSMTLRGFTVTADHSFIWMGLSARPVKLAVLAVMLLGALGV